MKSRKIIAVLSAVTVFSAGMISGFFINDLNADAENTVNFDVNGDGQVNINDVVYLKNEILGNNEERELKVSMAFGGISFGGSGHGYGEVGKKIDDEFIISNYEEFTAFADKCYHNDWASKFDEEYFKEKSMLAICIGTNTINTYNLCTVKTDGTTLTAYLEIEQQHYNTTTGSTDFLLFEYNKSDFSGTQCNIQRTKLFDIEYCNDKPVIYLYPEEETDVNVQLDFNGNLTCTYPQYPENTGWNVTAMPDGTLYDENGLEYSYLYWEGISNVAYDMSEGFVVKGEDTAEFLREKLSYMGLTPREYNEFIVYWLPRMQNNEYNLISFQKDVYTDNAVLNITPQPDSILRIFMTYKPLNEYIEIPQQELDTFERKGFTVVEWGGSEIGSDMAE
jgi:hypothetical protein